MLLPGLTPSPARVIQLLRSMHGGQDYVATFGHRQKGSGPFAGLISQRFRLALRRLNLNERRDTLRTDLFTRPVLPGGQYQMFRNL